MKFLKNYRIQNYSGEFIHAASHDNSSCKISIIGNDKQKTRQGYNLINLLKFYTVGTSNTSSGVEYIINDDGSITLNGTATGGLSWIKLREGAINPTEAKNYFYKCFGLPSTCYTNIYNIGDVYSENTKTFKVSANSEVSYTMAIIVPEGVTINATIKPMLIEGTVEKPFEQYGVMPSLDYPSEIQTVKGNANVVFCNKNLLDTERDSQVTYQGLTIDVDEDGVWTLNGTTGTTTYVRLHKDNTNVFSPSAWNKDRLKKETYTFGYEYISGTASDSNVNAYVRTNNTVGTTLASLLRMAEATSKKARFILSEDTDIVSYMWINSGNTFDNFKIKFQLEIGLELTEYTKPQRQAYAIDVQDEMLENDYFDTENNKEVHTWLKLVLDGTNNVVVQATTNTEGKYRYQYPIYGNLKKGVMNCSKTEAKAYCSHLAMASKNTTYALYKGFTTSSSILYIYTDGATAEEFNEYLKTNPMTFYIPLQENYYTKLDLTDNQKTQLEAINKAKAYNNITNIYSNDVLSPILKATFKTPSKVSNISNTIFLK